jgi:biotin carboxylase
MNNVVMIVGGSKWQVDIIKAVKDHGFDTLVTDISADAPGRQYADAFYQIDSLEKEALLKVAREHKIAFAIAEQTDRVVPVVAYINEQLKSHGINPETASRFTDKYIMRESLRENGLTMPKYYLAGSLDCAINIGEELGYPLILKPRSSQSSFGVFKIESKEELALRFGQSLEFSKDGTLLIEEYIPGIEITVEGFCIDGKCFPLAISEKEHYPENDCVSRKLIYPPVFESQIMVEIRNYIVEVVETLSLKLGIFHAELKVFRNKIYLLEVAARGGGHKIASVIVPHVSGVNVYELLIKGLNGEKIEINTILNQGAVLGFFDFAPGVVKKINGLDLLNGDERIYEFHLNFKEGEEIKKVQNDVSRAGYYIALCKNREEVDEIDKKILSSVFIEYETAN